MRILLLSLISFRNITRMKWELGAGRNIIVGDNGQGKTNLLEAIHTVFNLRSMRTSNDFKPLIHRGSQFFNIRCLLEEDDGKKADILLAYDGSRRKLTVDRNAVSPRDFMRNHPLVFFSPDQASLLADSPEMRRRLTDRFIFSLYPEYYDLLNEFKLTMRKRNAILKTGGDLKLVNAIDASFAPLAYRVSRLRREFINKLAPHFRSQWIKIKPELEVLDISYGGQGDVSNSHQMADLLLANLETDRRTGRTGVGPNVEDILFRFGNELSRHYLSHGERKIASFCFNLAFAELCRTKENIKPVMLIDDISSELDSVTLSKTVRSVYEMDFQTIITTIDRSFLEQWSAGADCWRIDSGNLTTVDI